MRPLFAILAVLALTAAGCGGSDNNGSSASSSTGSSSSSSGGAYGSSTSSSSGGAKTSAIMLKDFAFSPATATVKVGQKVTWTNEDSTVHNVISSDGTLKSKDLSQGDTYSFTPKKAGTISYVCTFHPNMKATLTVTG